MLGGPWNSSVVVEASVHPGKCDRSGEAREKQQGVSVRTGSRRLARRLALEMQAP